MAGIVAALCAGTAMAQPAPDAVEDANRDAYRYSMRCFVANGVAMGDWRDAGKPTQAAAQETKARLSFDTAVKLGNALGFSGSRINQDFGLAQAKELPKLVTDRAYFRQTVVTCKALGLM